MFRFACIPILLVLLFTSSARGFRLSPSYNGRSALRMISEDASSPRELFVNNLEGALKVGGGAVSALFGAATIAQAKEGAYGVEIPPLDRSAFTKSNSGLEYLDTKLGEGATPLPGF